MAKSARLSAPAPPSDPPAEEPTAVDEADLLAASVARVEHRLRLLDELAEIAMEMARGVAEQSRAVKAAAAGEARDLRASIERAEAAQERVIEQVQMVIAREAESEADSCDLLAALDERLNDDIDYIDIDSRPLREAVERICGDLDLKPDWSRWTDEGWPEHPVAVFAARPAWSPFNRPSRKPLLYKNRDYERQEFDPIARSP